jgi:2-succinyl-5-enolpyruvyl-6-hydroxy-3-cyclohexene-1-carboxylate synthase
VSATKLARSIVRELIEYGVSEFVLSPGSRNAPLSIALYQAEEAGLIKIHIRIDERGAGFFALGLAKASDNYVAVICTSGTAAANYHPAALEAYHSKNKLLIITADRPMRLRRTGANQTTIQVGLLSPLHTFDIANSIKIADHLDGGPIHLNVQFDEPLLPSDDENWLAGISPRPKIAKTDDAVPQLSVKSKGLLIVGHDRAGFDVGSISLLAKELSWPVIAEDPLSFPEAVAHAALFISDPELRMKFKPEQIIVIGRTTLSRSINALISECQDVVVIDPRTTTVDTERSATTILTALPIVSADENFEWSQIWKTLSHLAASQVKLGWSEQAAITEITSNLPEGSALFIGSSRPIRDVEAFAKPRAGLHTFANRGLAGIDGNIACTFGIAEYFERTFAIVGDLTALHDISALANSTSANLTIFIIDNDGGGIFSTLPQSGVEGFEKIFATPHHLDIEAVVRGFGVEVTRVKSASDIERAIVHFRGGLNFVVVEVPDRETNARVLKELTQSLVSALRMGSNLA